MKKNSIQYNAYQIYDDIISKNNNGIFSYCKSCHDSPCERSIDDVVLLPFEESFILDRLKENKVATNRITIKSIQTEIICPCYVNKKCDIHSSRPIDCRSYPLIPIFLSNNKFSLKVSSNCPNSNKISQNFYKRTRAIWKAVFPLLSEGWKTRYNNIASAIPLRELPQHINS